jgi:hypothetical protein
MALKKKDRPCHVALTQLILQRRVWGPFLVHPWPWMGASEILELQHYHVRHVVHPISAQYVNLFLLLCRPEIVSYYHQNGRRTE